MTFRHAFTLDSIDQEWPAGDYTIETEEEPLDSLSVAGFRRVCTTMIVRPPKGRPGRQQFIEVDPEELEEAHLRDEKMSERADKQGRQA